MTPTDTASNAALKNIEAAFDKFWRIITPSDYQTFESLKIEELRQQIQDIEARLDSKVIQLHLKRFVAFINVVEKDYPDAFEKISGAYQLISQALPRFDRYAAVFEEHPDFASVLGEFYVDIVHFHSQAYSFLRRRSWKTLFFSSWKCYNNQFRTLLDNLKQTTALLDQEAQSFEIVEAHRFRESSRRDAVQKARDRASWQLRDTFSWLGVDEHETAQNDELDRHLNKIHPETCRWLQEIDEVKKWMLARQSWLIWLSGKPGAGKSLLSASLVNKLTQTPWNAVMYFYCAAAVDRSDTFSVGKEVLKVAIAQLLHAREAQTDLVLYVHEEYVAKNRHPNLSTLSSLLATLIGAFENVFWIVDGLDELEVKSQSQIAEQIARIIRSSGKSVCTLYSARDTQHTGYILAKAHPIVITEAEGFRRDIQSLVDARLQTVQSRFSPDVLLRIRDLVLEKADGMFLWVELALSCLDSCCNSEELFAVAEDLPRGLEPMYARIFEKLERLPFNIQQRVNRIFNWILFSARSMLLGELRVGVCLHRDSLYISELNWPTEDFLDVCKPLVEIMPNGRVAMVHLSAREYLLRYHLTPFTGHSIIAIGCGLYFRSCSVFLENDSRAPDAYHSVSQGYHRLQSYALASWPFHVVSLLREIESKEGYLPEQEKNKPLKTIYDIRKSQAEKERRLPEDMRSLNKFRQDVEEKMWFLVQLFTQDPTIGPELEHVPWFEVESLGKVDLELQRKYRNLPPSKQISKELYLLRKRVEQHPLPAWYLIVLQFKKWGRLHCDTMRGFQGHLQANDPTCLTEIYFRQRAVVEEIATNFALFKMGRINGTSTSTRDVAEVGAALMSAYNNRPFLCIFGDCPSSCDGFALAQERDDHEEAHFRWSKPSSRCYNFLDGDGGPPPPHCGRSTERYQKIRDDQMACHRQVRQDTDARLGGVQEHQTQEAVAIDRANNRAQLRRRAAREDLRAAPLVEGPFQDLTRFAPEPAMIPPAMPRSSMQTARITASDNRPSTEMATSTEMAASILASNATFRARTG